jgi:hypothetical protein
VVNALLAWTPQILPWDATDPGSPPLFSAAAPLPAGIPIPPISPADRAAARPSFLHHRLAPLLCLLDFFSRCS